MFKRYAPNTVSFIPLSKASYIQWIFIVFLCFTHFVLYWWASNKFNSNTIKQYHTGVDSFDARKTVYIMFLCRSTELYAIKSRTPWWSMTLNVNLSIVLFLLHFYFCFTLLKKYFSFFFILNNYPRQRRTDKHTDR